MSSGSYNYPHFCLTEDEHRVFDDFRRGLYAGGPAPDGELIDARTEQPIRLSALWQRKHLILEFGSFT